MISRKALQRLAHGRRLATEFRSEPFEELTVLVGELHGRLRHAIDCIGRSSVQGSEFLEELCRSRRRHASVATPADIPGSALMGSGMPGSLAARRPVGPSARRCVVTAHGGDLVELVFMSARTTASPPSRPGGAWRTLLRRRAGHARVLPCGEVRGLPAPNAKAPPPPLPAEESNG